MQLNFTEKRLASITKPCVLRDTTVRGLVCRVRKTSKSYAVMRDLWAGDAGRKRLVRSVTVTLGRVGELTLDEARTKALSVIADIKNGNDPNRPPQPAFEPVPVKPVTVEDLFNTAVKRMRSKERTDRTIDDHLYMLEKYLPHLKNMPAAAVQPGTLAAEHERITEQHGPVVANKAMRAYRSSWNAAFKKRLVDGVNPVCAVDFHPERKRTESILADDLADWYERLTTLPSKARRLMHELGLFSGLRPGMLVALERQWVHLEQQRIVIPRRRMKVRTVEADAIDADNPFVLPLSAHMAKLVGEAMALSEMNFEGSPWLFPTRSADGRAVKPTQVWRERRMPNETGHILRKTYRTQATAAGVSKGLCRILMDHRIRDIEAHYENTLDLFQLLLAAQERISKHLLQLTNRGDQ